MENRAEPKSLHYLLDAALVQVLPVGFLLTIGSTDFIKNARMLIYQVNKFFFHVPIGFITTQLVAFYP